MMYANLFLIAFMILHLTVSFYMLKYMSRKGLSDEAIVILDEVRDTKKCIAKLLDRKKPGPKPKKIKEKIHAEPSYVDSSQVA